MKAHVFMENVNARPVGLENTVKLTSTNATVREHAMVEGNALMKKEDLNVIAKMATWVMNVRKKKFVTPQQLLINVH